MNFKKGLIMKKSKNFGTINKRLTRSINKSFRELVFDIVQRNITQNPSSERIVIIHDLISCVALETFFKILKSREIRKGLTKTIENRIVELLGLTISSREIKELEKKNNFGLSAK